MASSQDSTAAKRQEYALEHEQDFPCVVCGASNADWDEIADELRCPDHQETASV